jgi:ABC-type transport system involved in cytochrome c biogenesis ATPase subunit
VADDILLRIEDLHFAWPGGPALFNGWRVALPAGLTWLTGEDGSGKSTLLALAAGALTPQRGRLCAAGVWLDEAPQRYRQQVFRIDPLTETHDALAAAQYLEGLATHWPQLSAAALDDLTEGFDLRAHLHKPIYMLSTGTRRKLWLSAAFAAGAPVTLIDQPFAALDKPAVGFLSELLQDVQHHPKRAWWVADHTVAAGMTEPRVIHLA